MLEVDPKLKGQIDRFGNKPDGEIRYMIAPYLLYKKLDEFKRTDSCAQRHRGAEAAYYGCLISTTVRRT